jgi:hypothetical protein|tara:strand:- start:138 stop:632 length:495 start_codon:yes stop_codon:yes gene_type:complete
MITFRQVIGFLETIADKHYEINSFHSGGLDEVDIKKLGAEDYAILYADPGEATIDTGVMTYSFKIYVMDMVNDQIEGDEPNNQRLNRVDTFSETLQILHDVINEFKQSINSKSWVDNEVVLETPIICEAVVGEFANELIGWSADISVDVNNPNNLCIAPITANS